MARSARQESPALRSQVRSTALTAASGAAERYHRGLAPMLIATGGINRHTGIVEGREFARLLIAAGTPGYAIAAEDQSGPGREAGSICPVRDPVLAIVITECLILVTYGYVRVVRALGGWLGDRGVSCLSR